MSKKMGNELNFWEALSYNIEVYFLNLLNKFKRKGDTMPRHTPLDRLRRPKKTAKKKPVKKASNKKPKKAAKKKKRSKKRK